MLTYTQDSGKQDRINNILLNSQSIFNLIWIALHSIMFTFEVSFFVNTSLNETEFHKK